MAVALHHDTDLGFVHVRLTDKLTRDDYQVLVPDLEALMAAHGKLRILFEHADAQFAYACDKETTDAQSSWSSQLLFRRQRQMMDMHRSAFLLVDFLG